MKYKDTRNVESIDMLGFVASILRKRRWLVIAALAGALLLGLYKGVFRPEKAGSDTEIEELQKAIDDNRVKLSQNEVDIVNNKVDIVAKQESIAADEALLVTQQELKAALEENLAALRTTLERSEEVLANPNASSSQLAEVIMQILTLTDDITAANNNLNTAATRVSNTQKEIATLQTDIEKLTADSEALEKSITDLHQEISTQEADMKRLAGNAGMGTVIKYAMLGAALGVLIVCCIVLLQYLRCKKLRTSDELKEQYDLPVFGEFCSADALEHKKFDKMLDQLAGDIQTLPEKDRVYELIAAGIQALETPLPVRLIITGTVGEEMLREVSEWLCKFLPEDYEVFTAANPVYNAGFLAEIRMYTVLLVEAKMVSDKREVAKLAEVLDRNEVNVIGAVVL